MIIVKTLFSYWYKVISTTAKEIKKLKKKKRGLKSTKISNIWKQYVQNKLGIHCVVLT